MIKFKSTQLSIRLLRDLNIEYERVSENSSSYDHTNKDAIEHFTPWLEMESIAHDGHIEGHLMYCSNKGLMGRFLNGALFYSSWYDYDKDHITAYQVPLALHQYSRGMHFNTETEYAIASSNHEAIFQDIPECDCEHGGCFVEQGAWGSIVYKGPCVEPYMLDIISALEGYPILNDGDLSLCFQCEEWFRVDSSSSGYFCSDWCEDQHREDYTKECDNCGEQCLKHNAGLDAEHYYHDIEAEETKNGCTICDKQNS